MTEQKSTFTGTDHQIVCPTCGTRFNIDETAYAAIVQQIRDDVLESEITRRMEDIRSRMKAENDLSMAESEKAHSNWKLDAPQMVKCPKCGEYNLSHRVCKACGFYDGKIVVAKEEA